MCETQDRTALHLKVFEELMQLQDKDPNQKHCAIPIISLTFSLFVCLDSTFNSHSVLELET